LDFRRNGNLEEFISPERIVCPERNPENEVVSTLAGTP
jgi:hypothetical protein